MAKEVANTANIFVAVFGFAKFPALHKVSVGVLKGDFTGTTELRTFITAKKFPDKVGGNKSVAPGKEFA